jgi:hypothetical protein
MEEYNKDDRETMVEIQYRIDLFEASVNNNQYAELLYEYTDKDGNSSTTYLPEVIEFYIQQALEGDISYYTFGGIWSAVTSYYGPLQRVTDGTLLEILDLAIVWLSKGLTSEPRNRPPPFNVLIPGLSAEDFNDKLHKIIINHISKTLYEERDSTAIFSQKNIIDSANALDSTIKIGLDQQVQVLKALNLIENNYANMPNLPFFDDELESISYSFQLITQGEKVYHTPSFEKEFFDFCLKVGPTMPFCSANLDEVKVPKNTFQSVDQRWFKVHRPNGKDLETYHKNGWTREASAHTIVMFLFMGEREEEAVNMNPKDFIKVTYSFRKGTSNFGTLSVTLTQRNEHLFVERFNRHLINYKISANPSDKAMKVIHIAQKFLIPGLQIDDAIFMHMISTDLTASTLLRMNEVEKPWSLKKIMKFTVFLLGHITIRLRSEEVKSSTRPVKTKGVFHAIMGKDKIVTVHIEAQNMEQYKMTRFFILKVLTKYTAVYKDILDFYRSWFEPNRPEIPPISKMGTSAEDGEFKNIKLLRYTDPEVWWDAGYARPVAPAADLQVMPIKESDIEKYRRMGRDVIRWPVKVKNLQDSKVWEMPVSVDPYTGKPLIVYYTASTDDKPHITLVQNPGPNGKKYPLIPKCQVSESEIIVDDNTWEISIFSSEKAKVTKGDLVTLKILDAGRNGTVHGSITQYLGVKSMIRLGMYHSPSSFLRCVMVARQIDEFHENHETPESEEKVVELRVLLGDFASVCKQENPEMTIEQIRAELVDPGVFLDPSRHYRAVEELMQVNIFTAVANANKELMLEAPKCSGPYFRSVRNYDRDSVIIVKLDNNRSKQIRYQCELLGVNEDGISFRFGDNATKPLEKAIDSLTKSINVQPVCQVVETEEGWAGRQSISVETSTENKILIPEKLLNSIVAQKLDSLGKLRAIEVSLDGVKTFWCIMPAIEPLANENGAIPLGEITACSPEVLKLVVETHGKKGLHYTPCDEMLAGIWFFLEEIYVFIPLVPTRWNTKFKPVRFDYPYIPLVSKNSSQTASESYTATYIRLRRVMAILIQVLKRLYISSELSVDDFAQYHMIVDEKASKMEVNTPTHIIPKLNFVDLKNYFIKILPTFFKEGKLLCDSQRLYDNLVSRLRTFRKVVDSEIRARMIIDDPKLTAEGKPTPKPPGSSARVTDFPPHFEEFHVTLDDFKIHPETNQTIFLSFPRYLLEMNLNSVSRPIIVRKINATLLKYRTPVFYMYEDSNISALYLVQNVLDGDASRAATLAMYWRQNKVNLGYHCPNHVGSDSVVNLRDDNLRIENPHVPMIVSYGSGEFAALLSLNAEEN